MAVQEQPEGIRTFGWVLGQLSKVMFDGSCEATLASMTPDRSVPERPKLESTRVQVTQLANAVSEEENNAYTLPDIARWGALSAIMNCSANQFSTLMGMLEHMMGIGAGTANSRFVPQVVEALGGQRLASVRTLFAEYANSLPFSLDFQKFEDEFTSLPGLYAPPAGRLLLCEIRSTAVGCVAMKPLDQGRCEMKRLFVAHEFRGRGVGSLLARRVVDEARGLGYIAMRLDTIANHMPLAMKLYRSLGFVEIAPYYDHPVPSACFMELKLV